MPIGLDQLVDLAGRGAVDVGHLDHRGEGLLGRAPWLEEVREVAAPPERGDAGSTVTHGSPMPGHDTRSTAPDAQLLFSP